MSISARAERRSVGAWMGLAGARACEGGWLRRATCEPVECARTKERDERSHPWAASIILLVVSASSSPSDSASC